MFLKNFLTIHAEIENARLKLALAILPDAPITVANDAIEMPPHVTDKTIKDLSKRKNIFTEPFAN